jgi:hypothetical protein
MDDEAEKKPAVEHAIFGIASAPGRDPDPSALDMHVANGWAIGAAYGVPHPSSNAILHYFVLHRPIKPVPMTVATVSQDGTVRTSPPVPTTGSGVKPPETPRQGRRR